MSDDTFAENPIPTPAFSGNFFRSSMKANLVQDASKIVEDPRVLINMVSKRVRQLNAGSPALVRQEIGMGHSDVALMEIIEGKIVLDDEAAEA
ncbi:MAG: DNA-directed RNA polymerase subunit omega [Verrucomicrobiota bacterium]